jgi:hypothetical protein
VIYGEPSDVEPINFIDLGMVNVDTLVSQDISEVTLPVILPNGLYCDDYPSSVTVKVSYPGLTVKEIRIPNEYFADISGYEYADSYIVVKVIGGSSVSELTASDFTVIPVIESDIDHAQKVPALVTVKRTGVSVMGKYFVNIVPLNE